MNNALENFGDGKPKIACQYLWRVSSISPKDLTDELMCLSNLDYEDEDDFLKPANLLNTAIKILGRNVKAEIKRSEEDKDPTIPSELISELEKICNAFLEFSRGDVMQWASDFKINCKAHPEKWISISRYLSRVLRGEIVTVGLSAHRRFDESKDCLLRFLKSDDDCKIKPGTPWEDAWIKIKNRIDRIES